MLDRRSRAGRPPAVGGADVEERRAGERLAELVEQGDPAALLRAVDGLCASRDWAGLVDLRRRLEAAVERGRPLWPVTTYVEYRLALDGPPAERSEEHTSEIQSRHYLVCRVLLE